MNLVASSGEAEALSAPARSVGPFHVAVIMDGNGRWAQKRSLPRPVGHRKGAECVKMIIKSLPDLGITHFTIYAFSTENWRRSTEEVLSIMGLFERYIRREARELHESSVQVRFIGDRSRLKVNLQRLMGEVEEMTAGNTRLILNIAINYGGQDEILRACRSITQNVLDGTLNLDAVNAETLSARLDLKDQPAPDLIIRTGGYTRVSNFLLWHAAYAEYAFTETLWPDFTPNELSQMVVKFRTQTRNFGGV